MKVTVEIEVGMLQNIMKIVAAADPLRLMVPDVVRNDLSEQVAKQMQKIKTKEQQKLENKKPQS